MGFAEFIAAVFAGNVLTLAFAWGCVMASKSQSESDISWLVYASVFLPLVFVIMAGIATEGLPPFLAATASP